MFKKIIFISSLTLSTMSFISTATDSPLSLETHEPKGELLQQFQINKLSDIQTLFPNTTFELQSIFETVKRNTFARLQEIIAIAPQHRTYANTVLEFDKTLSYYNTFGSITSTLKMLHPDPKFIEKAEKILVEWSDLSIKLFEANKEIFQILKKFKASSNEYLNKERSYYLSNLIENYERNGLELEDEKYLHMQELKGQIALLCMQFQSNIDQDASTLKVSFEELQGLNESFINSLDQEGEQFILRCDYPTRNEIMGNCSLESTRKKYLHTFGNRAYPKNVDVLNELINKRDELAKILGYTSYADYDLAPEMAKTVSNVESMLDKIAAQAYPRIKNNWTELLKDLPQSVILTEDGKIKPWDVAYLKNQHIQKYFNVDDNEVAKYFPLETTIHHLFNVYEQFFDLDFRLIKEGTSSYWDSSVQTIEIRQRNDEKSIIGYVLLDLFPRENKFSHCCCNCILPPMSFDKGKTFAPALAVVIANFSKSTPSTPALLKHQEVKIFFHEFGHAIHALLGKSEMPSKSGYESTMDFVETPSQLLEEWLDDHAILKMVSSHYETGLPLTDELINGLTKTKSLFDAASYVTGGNGDHAGTGVLASQISLFLFKEGQNKDLGLIDRTIYDNSPQIVAYDPEIHHMYAFGHLTAYGAKYYSYLWSKQLATEIFAYIKSHGGLLDPVVGRRYVSKVIGRGGCCDPNELVTDFLEE